MVSTAIDCAETSYTTSKGQQFSLYCNQDQPNIGDIGSAEAANIEECLNKCSVRPGQHCGAVEFDTIGSLCYFKNTNVTAVGAVSNNGSILGIENKTQYQPLLLECTNTEEQQTTRNGLAFTVYCNQHTVGVDMCTKDSPDCRLHTSNLEQCLDYCSTLHPLCTGVDWVAGLDTGFINCYPKNATTKALDDARRSFPNTQFAKALFEVGTDGCHLLANRILVASNAEIFNLSCEEDRPGNNITVQHADSLSICVDSCTAYADVKCLGVAFDSHMVNGYENCYLKSATGVSLPGQNSFTSAIRQNSTTTSTSKPENFTTSSTPTPEQKHKGNLKWIAGPVTGSVVIIAAILAAVWWWHTRKKKKETHDFHDTRLPDASNIILQEAWQKPELDHAAERYEIDSSTRIYELDARSNRLRT